MVSAHVISFFNLHPDISFAQASDGILLHLDCLNSTVMGLLKATRGGGVIQDNFGTALYAYSSYYGLKTSIWAEAQAPLEGLKTVLELKLLDSLIEENILNGVLNVPWSIFYIVESIKEILKTIHVRVSHIYREGNQIADVPANWGITYSCNRIFYSSADLPAAARGAAKLDR